MYGYFRASPETSDLGRLDATDQSGARRVAIVNQMFVCMFPPGENPIGKRFRHNPKEGEWPETIGVVEDGKYRPFAEAPTPTA
jgi:hypothetical protein